MTKLPLQDLATLTITGWSRHYVVDPTQAKLSPRFQLRNYSIKPSSEKRFWTPFRLSLTL